VGLLAEGRAGGHPCLIDTGRPSRYSRAMTELYERLASRVREERESAKLSQAELAERSGLSRSQLANIETGRQRPPLDAIYKLSIGLNVGLDALLPRLSDISLGRLTHVEYAGQTVTPLAAALLRDLDAQHR